jgi:hypothetical protein
MPNPSLSRMYNWFHNWIYKGLFGSKCSKKCRENTQCTHLDQFSFVYLLSRIMFSYERSESDPVSAGSRQWSTASDGLKAWRHGLRMVPLQRHLFVTDNYCRCPGDVSTRRSIMPATVRDVEVEGWIQESRVWGRWWIRSREAEMGGERYGEGRDERN